MPQTFGPFSGYDWMTINKYGGYQSIGDPRNDQAYNGGTAGSGFTGAHWTLYLPLEISQHDALGDLQNQSDNSVYRVAVTAAASTSIFTTAPTNAPTIELKVEQDSYSEPVAALALGGRPIMNAPPLPGTRQCWRQERRHRDPGRHPHHQDHQRHRVCLPDHRPDPEAGGTSRANGQSDYPDPLEIWLGGTRVKRLGQNAWKTKIGRRFSLVTKTADAAMGPENGVRILNWDSDVGIDPGNDARRKLFRTQDGNVFKIVGTWANAGTLWINSNYVIPSGGPANNAQIVA